MITNEIKARIFAQYLGSIIELDNEGSKVRNRKLIAVGGWDDELYVKLRLGEAGKNQFVHAVFMKEKVFALCLKPLSSITDDECVELFDLMFKKTNETKSKEFKIDIGRSWVGSYLGNSERFVPFNYIYGFQFLQSKGYAMPYMEYSVEDLVNEGIYKLID